MLNILLYCSNNFFFQLKIKSLIYYRGFWSTLLAVHERYCVKKLKTVAVVKIRDIKYVEVILTRTVQINTCKMIIRIN